MTDADLARCLRLHEPEEWRRKLVALPYISSILKQSKASGEVIIRSAASGRLEPVAARDWLAVGDTASRFDPLSSQGILKALRSGIFASYAIGDLLIREDDSGLDRYRRYVLEEFKRYAEVRAKYYQEEQRWPASEFWRRRQRKGFAPEERNLSLSEGLFRSSGAFKFRVDSGSINIWSLRDRKVRRIDQIDAVVREHERQSH
jgi:hypothetical protein